MLSSRRVPSGLRCAPFSRYIVFAGAAEMEKWYTCKLQIISFGYQYDPDGHAALNTIENGRPYFLLIVLDVCCSLMASHEITIH